LTLLGKLLDSLVAEIIHIITAKQSWDDLHEIWLDDKLCHVVDKNLGS
jgi:hypothetical protein